MAKRPNTPNFDWPLLLSQGLQVNEIIVLNETLTKIDGDVFNLGETLKNFKVSFKDIQDLPTTLEGYGILDAYTDKETDAAIKAACDALKGEAPADLSTLEALAKALANDPKFSETIAKALANRVAVDTEQTFKLAEKQQARDNIEAVGVVDKGAANGVAPLDASSKVPPANLPQLTTTATVGAAMAGANAIQLPDDGDTFAGVKAGTSTMFRITWGNIKAAISTLITTVVSGNMSGRAYPRRSDGAAINLVWAGQGGTPTYIWGGGEPGTNFYPYSPSQMSVNYANSANWANSAGNANTVGSWDINAIVNRIEDRSYWRTRDYLLAEHIPVGGYAFLRAANGVKVDPGGYVGGNSLGWSNVNQEYIGPINYGTWQLCGWIKGTGYGEDQTTVWKRTA